jgi:Mg-chelatase subunit ChlD
VPFTVKTGQTASWKLASDRHIKGIRVIIKQGDGRAKITVDQTTATAAAAPTAAGAAATGAPAARPTRQPTRTAASAGGSTRQAPQTTASSDAAIPRMVLVLDASGSMWGQLQGEAKIAIAKKVMADLIATIPPSFQTGLTVYGHRRKGDCDDIEMIIPVGPHNAREMTAKVQAISPKGKTPLSAAVKQAAEALRYTEERATVVLVSDGLETCDIDPCELAAELAMSGVDFTVHVIGFDISVGDQERLRCLADKTGGCFSCRQCRFAARCVVQNGGKSPGATACRHRRSRDCHSEWAGLGSCRSCVSGDLAGARQSAGLYRHRRKRQPGQPLQGLSVHPEGKSLPISWLREMWATMNCVMFTATPAR